MSSFIPRLQEPEIDVAVKGPVSHNLTNKHLVQRNCLTSAFPKLLLNLEIELVRRCYLFGLFL